MEERCWQPGIRRFLAQLACYSCIRNGQGRKMLSIQPPRSLLGEVGNLPTDIWRWSGTWWYFQSAEWSIRLDIEQLIACRMVSRIRYEVQDKYNVPIGRLNYQHELVNIEQHYARLDSGDPPVIKIKVQRCHLRVRCCNKIDVPNADITLPPVQTPSPLEPTEGELGRWSRRAAHLPHARLSSSARTLEGLAT